MSKLYIIVDGHFSINDNFIGDSTNYETIHINKDPMFKQNLKSKEDITFPLFAIGSIEVYPKLTGEMGDEDRRPIINNDGVKETFKRLTSNVVFKSFEALIDVYAYQIVLNQKLIESIEDLKSKAESFGVKNLVKLDFNSELDEIKENSIEAENAFKEFFTYKISIIKKK